MERKNSEWDGEGGPGMGVVGGQKGGGEETGNGRRPEGECAYDICEDLGGGRLGMEGVGGEQWKRELFCWCCHCLMESLFLSAIVCCCQAGLHCSLCNVVCSRSLIFFPSFFLCVYFKLISFIW